MWFRRRFCRSGCWRWRGAVAGRVRVRSFLRPVLEPTGVIVAGRIGDDVAGRLFDPFPYLIFDAGFKFSFGFFLDDCVATLADGFVREAVA